MSAEKKRIRMLSPLTSRKEERGAVLILAGVGLVIAVIAASLAVDTGFLASDKRSDQKVADLAALDAVRDLANYSSRATDSATRNGFLPAPGPNYTVNAVLGDVAPSGAACGFKVVPNAAGKAVEVVVSSPRKPFFPLVGQATRTVKACAVASAEPMGGFSIGSALATIDTDRSAILNRFMGGILRGSSISTGLVSWQGLVTGNVTLEALRYQLGTMGFSVGTVDELLNANLSLAQLFQATAQALTAQGPTGAAQATILNTLRGQITATTLTTFKLGRFFTVQQGANDMALGSTLNVFQLVSASAQVANGSNLIDVSDVGITVPGVLTTKVGLKVIEPPKFYFGPKGVSVTTSQVELTVTPSLDLPISVLGLVGTRVKQSLPIKITGAGATGTLADVNCGTPSTMTVSVDPSAFSGSASTTLRVYADVIPVGNIPILDIPTTSVVPTTDGGPSDLVFNYPSQFPPPLGTETSKHAGSAPVGLNGLMTFTPGTPTVLNAVALPLLGTIVSSTMSALSPLVGQVDSRVLTPLLSVLGLDVGAADVTARALKCGTPGLVG